ncbi:MAG: hypothetical protein H7Z40_00475 [Phycisphaerae bacterium]|nr:hypothetical protein [Gemmatimonadaceae bacterium]
MENDEGRIPKSFDSLNQTAIAHLQGKYGQDVQVTSTKAVLAEILAHIDRRSVLDVGAVAAYDRGFDRTSPGYDKYYDRDRSSLSIQDLVSQPGQIGRAARD